MALAGTGSELGGKIAAKILAPDAGADARAAIIALWESIGDVIVDHIVSKTGLNVDAGIPVATAGTATAQTGATTAPGSGKIL
jgi:hypothetical protein